MIDRIILNQLLVVVNTQYLRNDLTEFNKQKMF